MIMQEPVKPSESDCCGSGCNPCILDVYEEQLKKYNASKNQELKNSFNTCLSPTTFSLFKLIDVKKHTKDCNLNTFRFIQFQNSSLEHNIDQLSVQYEPGQYLLLKGEVQGDIFQKAYTPLYVEDLDQHCFTILVKLYNNGRMSKLFKELTIGSKTLWRGPYGKFKIDYKCKHILFIAQGTGIAPFYTIISKMLLNEDCLSFLTLYFCCDQDNILLRDELYKLRDYWNFSYELFISKLNMQAFTKKYHEVVKGSRLGIADIKQFLNKVMLQKNSPVMSCLMI
ncbi:NADH-cytochrome b5 reductase-like [Anthonomus grandis grandis]|uniref:NADH-cytochrome b5 reductase-like n=1 Tax=Anthonomus grandis grandis TaxID=2921223 RepID=UPI002165502E|nr:NADH-cytochrome b5 reductase-like [Anthonomus grandis grandis]